MQAKELDRLLLKRSMALDTMAIELGMQRFTHPRREADEELAGRIWLYKARCTIEAHQGPVGPDHFLKNTTFPEGCIPPVPRKRAVNEG